MVRKSTDLRKLFIAVAALLLFILFFVASRHYFTEARIQAILSEAGLWAPAIYILFWAILPIFFFPVILLVVPCGYIFGWVSGTFYTLIGCAVNITIMYLLASRFARKPIATWVERKSGERIKTLFSNPSNTSQGVFFIFRLIPLISYNLINYMAGILKISFFPYLGLSLLGIMPGLVAFLYLGEQIHDPASREFKYAILFLILLTLFSLLLLYRYRKKSARD